MVTATAAPESDGSTSSSNEDVDNSAAVENTSTAVPEVASGVVQTPQRKSSQESSETASNKKRKRFTWGRYGSKEHTIKALDFIKVFNSMFWILELRCPLLQPCINLVNVI